MGGTWEGGRVGRDQEGGERGERGREGGREREGGEGRGGGEGREVWREGGREGGE